ncbi:hypothetical protein [Cryptosporangium sp. NPDC051539]|uniref:hypothetical protein n=1 Tax=Cryptosporangium sp. NPDC051539 TaxID=3363962 RepID=UPI003794BF1F
MTSDDERPDVIPSAVDPEIECVRIDGPVAAAPPGGRPDEPGPCPEGYVPRRRRRPYGLDGKSVLTGRPPEQNPAPPPE